MKSRVHHSQETLHSKPASAWPAKETGGLPAVTDLRPEAITQRKLQKISAQSAQQQAMVQLKATVDAGTQMVSPIQRKPNRTGLPDKLKAGVENLSGYSMDDVKVHYNSSKPAQLQAHAYAQGTNIHIAPGQEKHLPHEAWHVVQQKQGRVKPTMQLKEKSGVSLNNDNVLENEATQMGNRAWRQGGEHGLIQRVVNPVPGVIQPKLKKDRLNVVGENHVESADRRADEQRLIRMELGNVGYWTEEQFAVIDANGFVRMGDDVYDIARQFLGLVWLQIESLIDPGTQNLKIILNNTLRSRLQYASVYLNKFIVYVRNEPNLDARLSQVMQLTGNTLASVYFARASMFFDQTSSGVQANTNPIATGQGQYQQLEVKLVDVREKIRMTTDSGHVRQDDFNNEVKKIRSMKMHEAANAMYNTRGVWKIGNEHVTDIQQADAKERPGTFLSRFNFMKRGDGFGEIKYNLISKDMFNMEYDRLLFDDAFEIHSTQSNAGSVNDGTTEYDWASDSTDNSTESGSLDVQVNG